MTLRQYIYEDNKFDLEKAKKPVQVKSKTGKIFTQMREEGKKKEEKVDMPKGFEDITTDRQKKSGTTQLKSPSGRIYTLHKNGYVRVSSGKGGLLRPIANNVKNYSDQLQIVQQNEQKTSDKFNFKKIYNEIKDDIKKRNKLTFGTNEYNEATHKMYKKTDDAVKKIQQFKKTNPNQNKELNEQVKFANKIINELTHLESSQFTI